MNEPNKKGFKPTFGPARAPVPHISRLIPGISVTKTVWNDKMEGWRIPAFGIYPVWGEAKRDR
jgi:hypothetical protein